MYESTDTNLRVYAATRGSILGGGRRGLDNQSRHKMYSNKRGEEMAVAKLYISKVGGSLRQACTFHVFMQFDGMQLA